MIRNIYHCVAIGGLDAIKNEQPQPHTRIARLCGELSTMLLHDLTPVLPKITGETLSIGREVLGAVEDSGTRIAKEMKISMDVLVLNLVSFCMDELPVTKRHVRRLQAIFECFPTVDQYESARAGHRVWERLRSECEICLAA